MEKKYISIAEAAKIANTSVQAIYKKVKAATIPFRKVEKGGRSVTEVDREAVLHFAVGKDHKEKDDNQESRPAKQREDSDAIEKLISLLGVGEKEANHMRSLALLSEKQARTMLKAEQAIAAQRKNMVQAGSLIDLKSFEESLDTIFHAIFSSLRGVVEVWTFSLRFSPSQATEIKAEFEKALRDGLDKLRAQAKK